MRTETTRERGRSAALRACRRPKLRAGGYAAWKPDMDVYLERIGADGVHTARMSAGGLARRMVEQAGASKHEEAGACTWRTSASSDSGSGSSSSAATRRSDADGQGEGTRK